MFLRSDPQLVEPGLPVFGLICFCGDILHDLEMAYVVPIIILEIRNVDLQAFAVTVGKLFEISLF